MFELNKSFHDHTSLSCILTTTSSAPTKPCCMSTDTVVYPGTHFVYLQTRAVNPLFLAGKVSVLEAVSLSPCFQGNLPVF